MSSDACDNEKCSVTRGEPLQGLVSFTPESAHSSLIVTSHAYVSGFWTELAFEYPFNDVCQSLFRGGSQASCPTTPNAEYEWVLDFGISTEFPQLTNVPIQCENSCFLCEISLISLIILQLISEKEEMWSFALRYMQIFCSF